MSRPADIKTQFLEFYENDDIVHMQEMIDCPESNIYFTLWSWKLPEQTYIRLSHILVANHICNWEFILRSGCAQNLRYIVDLALAHGAQVGTFVLSAACGNGNKNMIEVIYGLCIDAGAHIDWPACLNYAGYNGELEAAQFIFEKCANDPVDTEKWNESLKWVCGGGNIHILNLLTDRYNPILIEWIDALLYACESDSVEIVQYIIQKHDYKFEWNLGLIRACHTNSIGTIQIMLEMGATNTNILTYWQISELLNRRHCETYFNALEQKCQHAAPLFEQLRTSRNVKRAAIQAHFPKVLANVVLEYIEYETDISMFFN